MVLLVDNYDSFTWNLVHRLAEIDPALTPDRNLRVVRNDQISLDAVASIDHGKPPHAIVISPGPCTPREAGVSTPLIARFAGRIPILGVCLGHQCLAAARGLPVVRHTPVHGKTSPIHHDGQGLFAGLPNPFPAMRYHSLVVPDDPHALARANLEASAWTFDGDQRVVMGLRDPHPGLAPVETVQFHPESFMTEAGRGLLRNFLALAGASKSNHPRV